MTCMSSCDRAHPTFFAKVTPAGFSVAGDALLPSLEGTIESLEIVRKLFHLRRLLCYSHDGETGSNGVRCAACLHSACQTRSRVRLCGHAATFILDLAYTSTRNLIAFFELDLERTPDDLGSVVVRLTTVDRGHWAEVCFERA